MKKLMIICTALFITGLASAQTADSTQHNGFHKGQAGMHRRQGGQGQMAQKLNLSDDQKAQLKTVNESYRKQMSDLKANTALSDDDRKTQFSALQKSHREEMNKVFTDDQKKILAESRGKMQGGRGHMGQRAGKGARGGVSLDKIKQELNLTDDQTAKLKTQREQLHTQMKSVREDSSLTADQKKEKVKQLFGQQKEQLKTILTPEQLTKLQSMRKGHMMNHKRHADGSGDNGQAK